MLPRASPQTGKFARDLFATESRTVKSLNSFPVGRIAGRMSVGEGTPAVSTGAAPVADFVSGEALEVLRYVLGRGLGEAETMRKDDRA